VRDLIVEIYKNIERWNAFHLQGINYIKLIFQEKSEDDKLNRNSKNLQDLCDKLEDVCDNLVNIFFN
jgi:predicted house-cleaning noncanonical NTP pyrophosphatase (MazG superfamily)